MRRCAPLVVAESGANADGNQTRQEGTHQGYKDVVSRPFEFFSRPERDKVTDPIGARLREFCAFHCPHLLPGQVGTLAQPGAGNAAGTYRRMLLDDVDAVRSRFVSQPCPPELARQPVQGQDSPTSGVFKVLEIALGAELVGLPTQSNVWQYGYPQYCQQRLPGHKLRSSELHGVVPPRLQSCMGERILRRQRGGR